jgi:single-strand DNA-binding protein
MANVNRVTLIGRLTRDPEPRTFSNGGKVAAFGFAVNNRKKDQTTGQWVDDPCFLDVKAFNRENGRKLADLVEQYLKKGHQAFIEGHLVMETWDDKNGGGKRSKLVIVLDDLQFLEPKSDGGNASGEGMARAPRPAQAPKQPSFANSGGGRFAEEPEEMPPAGNGGGDEEIPF